MSMDDAMFLRLFDSSANLIRVDASRSNVYAESSKRLPWQHNPKN